MASLQMDLPTANRFVNSLSKSLQALCHGCMDFDTEIEIVGYINVNIDCGSKVDYVLNEKVSKSQNNSMTFVSNSFLAKKDQPKSSKDRSCSPIPELHARSKAATPSSLPASQLYMSSGIYSPHSQVLRGSQKRSWVGGDWRASPRKSSRGARSHYDSFDSQSFNNSAAFSSSQTHSSSFPKPSTSQQDYNNSEQPSDVYIKTECDQSKEENSFQSSVPVETYSTNDENNTLSADVNIKADPDSSETQGNTDAKQTDSTSFLHPQNADDPLTSESNSSRQESESFLKAEQSDSTTYEGQDSENVSGENKNVNLDQGLSESHDQETFEDQTRSSYAEEEFGDGYQFDVIEIDDEDEDITAFSDEMHSGSGNRSSTSSDILSRLHYDSAQKDMYSTSDLFGATGSYNMDASPSSKCEYCSMTFIFKKDYQRHISTVHREEAPFHCTMCPKVYFTDSGFRNHLSDHGGRRFVCHICRDMKFKRNHHLQRHIKGTHNLCRCPCCLQYFKTQEFRQHILQCNKN